MQIAYVLLLGIAFHIVYIRSIFDIYFRSPLIHGVKPVLSTESPPAKRLILISGDGLRADTIFEPQQDPEDIGNPNPIYLAPFLRRKAQEGVYGISHTRVPTESRPGHVALIAGFYEDVSAVTKGWQSNPVEFDSVFNQSSYVWSYGSPDIVPMFVDGSNNPDSHITYECYDSNDENFVMLNATSLDDYVFNKIYSVLNESRSNLELNAKLNSGKPTFFFLHLLGLDMNGHRYRPQSKEYRQNLKFVDRRIDEFVSRIESFYNNDRATAYLFTSDHGMTDHGSHGDGSDVETKTPIIAWGAGIRKANEGDINFTKLGNKFASQNPQDISQADVTTLMAFLLGINYPVNSVGELPLEYLDVSKPIGLKAAMNNALHMFEQAKLRDQELKKMKVMYKPYKPLLPYLLKIDTLTQNVDQLIYSENFDKALYEIKKIHSIASEGLKYFQRYDWLYLHTIVSLGYIGWMIFCFGFLMQSALPTNSQKR